MDSTHQHTGLHPFPNVNGNSDAVQRVNVALQAQDQAYTGSLIQLYEHRTTRGTWPDLRLQPQDGHTARCYDILAWIANTPDWETTLDKYASQSVGNMWPPYQPSGQQAMANDYNPRGFNQTDLDFANEDSFLYAGNNIRPSVEQPANANNDFQYPQQQAMATNQGNLLSPAPTSPNPHSPYVPSEKANQKMETPVVNMTDLPQANMAALDRVKYFLDNDDDDKDFKGIIGSYAEMLELKTAYDSLNNDINDDLLVDFPEDAEGQKRLVHQLCTAITNTENILDNPRLLPLNKKGGNKKRKVENDDESKEQQTADSHAVERVKKMRPIEVEFLAWRVLYHIRDAQLGVINIPIWSKDWNHKIIDTFTARFKHVKDALTESKAIVNSLLDVDFHKRLACDPERELKRKNDNKRTNAIRDGQNKAGIYAISKGIVVVDNEMRGIKLAETGQTIAPSNPLSINVKKTKDRAKGYRSSQPRKNAPQVLTTVVRSAGGMPGSLHAAQNIQCDFETAGPLPMSGVSQSSWVPGATLTQSSKPMLVSKDFQNFNMDQFDDFSTNLMSNNNTGGLALNGGDRMISFSNMAGLSTQAQGYAPTSQGNGPNPMMQQWRNNAGCYANNNNSFNSNASNMPNNGGFNNNSNNNNKKKKKNS